MIRHAVNSSTVKFVGYDPATRLMQVEFVSGPKVYDFADVPPEVVGSFVFAESAGTYFARHIKGKYQAPVPDQKSFTVVECPICNGRIAGALNPPSGDFLHEAETYERRGFVIVKEAESAILGGCECQNEIDRKRVAVGNFGK